ncbi:MAG: hypothetical protein H6722_29190 [Sandaracinus sp.]|nr:hypothetical protein [Sandaracinus sp.]
MSIALVAGAVTSRVVAQAPSESTEEATSTTESPAETPASSEGTPTEAAATPAAAPEGTPTEAATPEAAPQATPSEAATPDAATPDAATPDAATPDAATPDAATPDAATPVPQDDLPPALRTRAAMDDEPLFAAPEQTPRAPWRVLASVGVGTSIRLVRNLELQQERFAPAYLELRGGVALPQRGRVGHELSLAVTGNLSGDGSYTSGIDPMQQWVLSPGYAVRVGFPAGAVPDFVVRGRVGIPVVLAPDVTWGVEVDASFTYALLAGLGIYAEVGYGTFFGAEDRAGDLTVNPVIGLELGAMLDWEVLR